VNAAADALVPPPTVVEDGTGSPLAS